MRTAIFSDALRIDRLLPVAFVSLVLVLTVFSECRAGEFHNALSLQGFTGLLNTPNAEVTEEGRFYALYSDQEESQWRNRLKRQENYLFSVGLFSIVELGGRVTEAPGIARDLSANFKIKVPCIPKGYYLPSIAFGMQDIGGGSKHLQTAYAVASEELWRFRLSLGYGTGPDRMDGVFGGVEFKAFDWLYLLGDYDTRETNAGIRLVTPDIFGYPINFNVTAKTSLDYRPGRVFEFGFGVQFPLGIDHYNRKPLDEKAQVSHEEPEEQYGVISRKEIVETEKTSVVEESARKDENREATLKRMKKALVEAGFQNVAVGSKDSLLVVEYENNRYNNNELDGLGVVAGIVMDHVPSALREMRLVLKKKGIRILQLGSTVKAYKGFLADPGQLGTFNESLRITTDVEADRGVRFVGGDENASWLTSSLVLYPGLKTFVASDYGVFDYILSLKPDFYLNTWKGAVINARWDVPVAWSENFDDGKPYRSFRQNSQFERLMLFQAIKLAPTVMANLGGGMILKDNYGTLNEVIWTPGNGAHRFRAKFAYSDDRRNHTHEEVYLGAYRYYYSPLDTYLEGTGGKFFDQDTGFKVELKRFFGDTAFSVYYKNSHTAEGENVQVGGVQFSFPLTPRKDMKPYIAQVRGSEEWSYAQETEIVSPGNRNVVGRSIGLDPQPGYNLERVFYNRDRLTEMYIRKHLLRLRDANIRYNEKAVKSEENLLHL